MYSKFAQQELASEVTMLQHEIHLQRMNLQTPRTDRRWRVDMGRLLMITEVVVTGWLVMKPVVKATLRARRSDRKEVFLDNLKALAIRKLMDEAPDRR